MTRTVFTHFTQTAYCESTKNESEMSFSTSKLETFLRSFFLGKDTMMPMRSLWIVFLVLQSSSGWSSPSCRRRVLESIVVSVGLSPLIAANAAETIGKESGCNDKSCLGVWDGLLADCPHGVMKAGAGCTSSQDDMPGIFAEP